MNPSELLECAVAAARAAGDHALQNAGRRSEAVGRFRHDVKLKLDIECQAVAEGIIRSRFPEHSVLGEEDAPGLRPQTRREHEWIIDPIDGTVNFSHGFPQWCCSVAVRRGEEVVAGAVYAPVFGALYTATADGPALCNGSPIHVSAVKDLASALVLTGLDKHPGSDIPPFAIFQALANNTQKARILGSAALDLCLVACGAADGYFETGIYLWDIAAAGLLVRRAGGTTDLIRTLPDNRLQYVASNGRLHSELKALIEATLRGA